MFAHLIALPRSLACFTTGADNAKQIQIHAVPGEIPVDIPDVSIPEQHGCAAKPVDSAVVYLFEKALTGRYEAQHSDVNSRTCPPTDILT